eukprot:211014-Amphidinium_carterae.1
MEQMLFHNGHPLITQLQHTFVTAPAERVCIHGVNSNADRNRARPNEGVEVLSLTKMRTFRVAWVCYLLSSLAPVL